MAKNGRDIDHTRSGLECAVFMAFAGNEILPFAGGNGRTDGAVIGAERTSGHESRIVVPTVFLDGLRALSRRGDPSVFI